MSNVVAELKGLHSPDVLDLKRYVPEQWDKFGFLLQAMFGPRGEEGEESFDIIVCTPKWLEAELEQMEVMSGRHYIFMKNYDFEKIRAFLVKYARRCSGRNWGEVAGKLARVGFWEFEDYTVESGA